MQGQSQAAKLFSYVDREVRSSFNARTSKRTLIIINNPLSYFNSLLYHSLQMLTMQKLHQSQIIHLISKEKRKREQLIHQCPIERSWIVWELAIPYLNQTHKC
jgi:hypothetical protein